jgi:hypothetical protein
MKKIILLFIFLFSLQLFSQEKTPVPELVYFNCDNTGNQIKRFRENAPIIMSEEKIGNSSIRFSVYPNPTYSNITLD